MSAEVKAYLQSPQAIFQACFPAQLRTLVRMDYRSRLKTAMKLAQADRRALADALGISVQAVGMVLAGTTKALTAENSAKAARFLGVDAHWLATGEGEARPLLMAERADLSTEAVEHAMQFDRLTVSEKRLWRTLVLAAKSGLSDAEVEERIPATRAKPVTHADEVLRRARIPSPPVKKSPKKAA